MPRRKGMPWFRRSRPSLLPLLLVLLFATILLASCQTPTIVTGVPCEAVPVITFSAPFMAEVKDEENIYDSRETVAQIRRNNAAWRAVCQKNT